MDPRSLQANPANWRDHNPEQREAMREVLESIGWIQRVIVNKRTGFLLDGHLRVEEAVRKNEPRVPVVFVDLSPAEEKKMLALLDPIAGMAGMDKEKLRALLADLRGESGGLEALLRQLRDAAGMNQELAHAEDVVPPAPAVPVSRRGDVWHLGRHRVVCGDATDAADYVRALGAVRADVLWTDPPYGVDYVGKTSAKLKIKNDAGSDPDLRTLVLSALRHSAQRLKPGGAAYVAHPDSKGALFRAAFFEAGFYLASVLIWRKNVLVLSRGDYHWRHEPVLYGWLGGSRHTWFGGRRRTTIHEFDEPPFDEVAPGEFHIAVGESVLVVRGKDLTVERLEGSVLFEDKPKASREHPTMKPVALIERMLANSAKAGQVVLDPFGGSGSTLIAAEARALSCRAIEIDPRYVDVIVRRWQTYTGAAAQLEGDRGVAKRATFEQVAEARGVAIETPAVAPGAAG